MSDNKYGKLVLGVLGAVQASSTNQLEKDLLGAVISIEKHDPQGLGQPMALSERSVATSPAPQIAAPVSPQPSAEPTPAQAPATAPEAPAAPTEPTVTPAVETPGPFKA